MRYMKGLRIDWDSGHGEVRLPEDFLTQKAPFRADVLRDWLFDLNLAYLDATGTLRSEIRKP